MEHVKRATLEALKDLDEIVWNTALWEALRENWDDRQRLAAMIALMKSEGMAWPVDKLNRWFGFIQGVLFTVGLIDILEERDRTRPLFHAAYKLEGTPLPESVDVDRARARHDVGLEPEVD